MKRGVDFSGYFPDFGKLFIWLGNLCSVCYCAKIKGNGKENDRNFKKKMQEKKRRNSEQCLHGGSDQAINCVKFCFEKCYILPYAVLEMSSTDGHNFDCMPQRLKVQSMLGCCNAANALAVSQT